MKRYTVGTLIHDAKVFNQLRLEYRRRQKSDRRKNPSLGLSVALLEAGNRFVRMIPRYARIWGQPTQKAFMKFARYMSQPEGFAAMFRTPHTELGSNRR
jgi:hypothetical protein